MVILENVTKKDNIIEADYCYPRDEEDKGHVVYDIKKGDYISIRYCKDDEEAICKYGFSKIVKAFKLMIQYDKYPKTYNYMWY